MSLPKWDPKGDEERRAFIDRVHDELMAERMKDGAESVPLLDDMRFRIEAAKRGYALKSGKRGPRFQIDPNAPLEQAKHDAKRLGAIFKRLWNRRNRQCDPSVVAILSDIWSLSDEDRAALEIHLSHKSSENG